ncbi:MAG: endonuclease III [Deltaproteobacteria bacterium]|nr:endonuclease III [Deltaproteobacteria bacterium]
MDETMQARRARAKKISALLNRHYPPTKTALRHRSPFELLVATILSAQCTDARVNMVTPPLFARFGTVQALANAEPAALEQIIRSTGFFKNKGRNLIACCRALVDRFHGKVPQTMDELVTLPGVGRKTANVVLGACWDIPGVVVDTHVKRLAGLLALTRYTNPGKIEVELMEVVPKSSWNAFSMNLILHGRAVCIARRPRCTVCVIAHLCPGCRDVGPHDPAAPRC